jgi:hypothetical protein
LHLFFWRIPQQSLCKRPPAHRQKKPLLSIPQTTTTSRSIAPRRASPSHQKTHPNTTNPQTKSKSKSKSKKKKMQKHDEPPAYGNNPSYPQPAYYQGGAPPQQQQQPGAAGGYYQQQAPMGYNGGHPQQGAPPPGGYYQQGPYGQQQQPMHYQQQEQKSSGPVRFSIVFFSFFLFRFGVMMRG